jgi:hypothetical protein
MRCITLSIRFASYHRCLHQFYHWHGSGDSRSRQAAQEFYNQIGSPSSSSQISLKSLANLFDLGYVSNRTPFSFIETYWTDLCQQRVFSRLITMNTVQCTQLLQSIEADNLLVTSLVLHRNQGFLFPMSLFYYPMPLSSWHRASRHPWQHPSLTIAIKYRNLESSWCHLSSLTLIVRRKHNRRSEKYSPIHLPGVIVRMQILDSPVWPVWPLAWVHPSVCLVVLLNKVRENLKRFQKQTLNNWV